MGEQAGIGATPAEGARRTRLWRLEAIDKALGLGGVERQVPTARRTKEQPKHHGGSQHHGGRHEQQAAHAWQPMRALRRLRTLFAMQNLGSVVGAKNVGEPPGELGVAPQARPVQQRAAQHVECCQTIHHATLKID